PPQGRLSEGRLDEAGPDHRRRARQPWPRRRAALPALWGGRARGGHPAVDPDPGHGGQGGGGRRPELSEMQARPTIAISRRLALAAGACAMLAPGLARAAATLGQPAPAFTAQDETGRTRSLREFAGKVVVLEWTSSDCPFSHKHYDSGNMQALQANAVKDGVVWLTVSSAARGRLDFFTPKIARAWRAKVRSHATAILLDGSGVIGRAYGARTTPHMFVID